MLEGYNIQKKQRERKKMQMVTMYIPVGMDEKVRAISKLEDRPMSELIREAISDYFKKLQQ